MASSNRHWPSMFKSKPCSSHSSQWQHDINPSLMSSCQQTNRPSFTTSSSAGEETRSPEPKPRWNPKPEQIRILEAIFNSGMVNPPRDEIRRIRIQLQEYGQVGDANVFYWFQNRKSRSKHKQRHLQNSAKHSSSNVVHQQSQPAAVTLTAPSSSSSSSSEKSSPKQTDKLFSIGIPNGINVIDVSNSPTASVNQTYFHNASTNSSTTSTTTHPGGAELISTHVPAADPFFFPVQHAGAADPVYASTQGLMCFPELANVVQFPDQHIGPCSSTMLLGELLNQGVLRKEEDERLKLQQLNYTTTTTATSTTTTVPITTPVAASAPLMTQIQEVSESEAMGPAAAARSTVFINREAFEVSVGPLNVRQAFGDDALLVYYPSGQPVPTNEWGVTLNSLTPGASYYVVYY